MQDSVGGRNTYSPCLMSSCGGLPLVNVPSLSLHPLEGEWLPDYVWRITRHPCPIYPSSSFPVDSGCQQKECVLAVLCLVQRVACSQPSQWQSESRGVIYWQANLAAALKLPSPVLLAIVTLTSIDLTPALSVPNLDRKEGVLYWIPQKFMEPIWPDSDYLHFLTTSFTHLVYCDFSSLSIAFLVSTPVPLTEHITKCDSFKWKSGIDIPLLKTLSLSWSKCWSPSHG